jgi:hypothetical protein
MRTPGRCAQLNFSFPVFNFLVSQYNCPSNDISFVCLAAGCACFARKKGRHAPRPRNDALHVVAGTKLRGKIWHTIIASENRTRRSLVHTFPEPRNPTDNRPEDSARRFFL